MPCFNCRDNRVGYVSWHHLLCIGQHGKGIKPHDVFTIPVCNECHKLCHDYSISRELQKEALFSTWCNVLNSTLHEFRITALVAEWFDIDEENLGEVKAWKKKGEAYWKAIGGEG
jgi:hypothetical protein